MKLTVEIGRDEELRLIQVEIRKITGDEIKKMAQEYLAQVNIAAKATSAIKDALNKQIDFLVKGYGDLSIKHEMEKKINDWIDKNFAAYFNQNVKGFIKGYVEEKVSTIQEFLDLVKKTKIK